MSKKVIALDAGHGMNTAGKRCLKTLDPDQTREWLLNDRIMDKVQELLADYDCVVIRTDDTTGARDISLSARCAAANNAGAVVFMSMHHNAGLNGRKGGGTVVFNYGRQAQAERLYNSVTGKTNNAGAVVFMSMHHNAGLNGRKGGGTVVFNYGRQAQAERLYNSVTGKTGLVGNRSQKVIKKAYYVLKHTKMAAFLVENGFMDSPSDVPVILTDSHARKTAEGVVDFLVHEYNLQKKTSQNRPQEKPQGALYYPAYTGRKTTLSVALQSLGIDYSYNFRAKIAAANGIAGYRGTAAQNTQMYNLLVAGRLKKA